MSEFKVNRQELLPPAHLATVNNLSRSPRPTDEDRAWTKVYDLVDREPATAREVVKQLESDPDIKQSRLALLILAKQTVRRHDAEQARRQRIAALVRRTIGFLFVAPFRLFASGATLAIDTADPPVKKEPAKRRAPALERDPDFVTAKTRFAHAGVTDAAQTEQDKTASAVSKAA